MSDNIQQNIAAKAYRKTDAYKLYLKKYRSRPEVKERERLRRQKYQTTEEYKAYQKKYKQSIKYKRQSSEYSRTVGAKLLNRASLYKRKYGIELQEYESLVKLQNGVCAVCGEISSSGRRLAIDHSHTTGRVRGLLCNNCNVGLGLAGDNIYRLLQLAEYLMERGE